MASLAPIEAQVTFDSGEEMTLNDLLFSVAHHRGFRLATSYCVLEVGNPHVEAMNEFMNHGFFTLKYGKEGRYIKPVRFEIFSVENSIAFSNVGVRVIGVEPGFVRLSEEVQMRSFQNQTIGDVISSLAQEAQLQTNLKATQGKGNFVQANISPLHFIKRYLLPISIDTAGTVPYLFTIDNNTLWYRPPNLTSTPRQAFILDTAIDTLTKRFQVQNHGSMTDFTYGNSLRTYGYDFTEKGMLKHDEDLDRVSSQKKLSRFSYESNFTRQVILPYDQQWQIIAENKNRLAKAQFVIQTNVILDGEPDYTFDELLKFSIPERGIERLKEYSMPYYVFSLCNVLKIRSFLSHLTLRSNAFVKNKTPGQE